MRKRGQAVVHHRKRWLIAVLIMLAALALAGLAFYNEYLRPKPVQVLWQAELPSPTGSPRSIDYLYAQIATLPAGGVALAGPHQLVIFDRDGQPVLVAPTPQGKEAPSTFGSRRIADEAGNVYFAFGDCLQSYDEQGRKRWEWKLPPATREDGKPDAIRMYQVTPEGTVIIASATGLFSEVSATGTTLHQSSSDFTLRGLVAFYKLDDGGYLFANNLERGVRDKGVARIASDGTEVWQKSFKGFAVHSLSVCGGLGLVSMHNGEVHALDSAGNDVWTYQVPPGVVTAGPTVHEVYPYDDRWIFIVTNGRLAALNRDGHIIWTLDRSYIADLLVPSGDRQYALELQQSKVLSGLYSWYLKHNPNQLGNIPVPPATSYILRVHQRHVTQRYRAPADTIRLAGPSVRSEFYLISNGKLYCVALR